MFLGCIGKGARKSFKGVKDVKGVIPLGITTRSSLQIGTISTIWLCLKSPDWVSSHRIEEQVGIIGRM